MRNSISKRMLRRFNEWFRGVGCVRAAGLALCVALLAASAGAQSTDGWRIDTIAGSGDPGHGGDGGPAVEARLSFPSGVAVDNAGNVYISDYYSQRVRRVDITGTITTITGTGEPGYGGDGGRAVEARLFFPWGVAADHAGNVYITDSWQPPRPADRYYGDRRHLRRDGAAGLSTRMLAWRSRRHWPSPTGVAVDGSGNLYILRPILEPPDCPCGCNGDDERGRGDP